MCLKQWDLGYQDLLDLSQLPTLENRRLYLKLCTLYEIIRGYFYFPPNVFVPQVSRQTYSLPLMHQPHAPSSHLLYLALFLFGITYPMKHLQHIPLIHLNHLLHPCFCIHNWLHTRISLPAICVSLHYAKSFIGKKCIIAYTVKSSTRAVPAVSAPPAL